jgi:cytochrome c556
MRHAVIAATLSLSLLAHADESVFPSKRDRAMAKVLEEQKLSAGVHDFLKSKMKGHNKDMRDLVIAVASLRFDQAESLARAIATQPRLDKTTAQARELPEVFFVMQDRLKQDANAVADAAAKKDVEETHLAFSDLMGTCMSCHAGFKTRPAAK